MVRARTSKKKGFYVQFRFLNNVFLWSVGLLFPIFLVIKILKIFGKFSGKKIANNYEKFNLNDKESCFAMKNLRSCSVQKKKTNWWKMISNDQWEFFLSSNHIRRYLETLRLPFLEKSRVAKWNRNNFREKSLF